MGDGIEVWRRGHRGLQRELSKKEIGGLSPADAGRLLSLLLLADPGVGVAQRLGGDQQVVAAKRIRGFPLLILPVEPD